MLVSQHKLEYRTGLNSVVRRIITAKDLNCHIQYRKPVNMRVAVTIAMTLLIAVFGCTEKPAEETTDDSTRSMETTEPETTPEATPEPPIANLLDGKWEANYIMNAPKALDELYPEGRPTIIFNTDQNGVSGNAGCNNFRGPVNIDDNKLGWQGELATTRKMCPDMAGEQIFLETLKKANAYSVTERGQTLNLIMGDMAVMRLTRVNE